MPPAKPNLTTWLGKDFQRENKFIEFKKKDLRFKKENGHFCVYKD